MTTFILFGKYSQTSIKEISAKRTEAATALIKENGGEVKAGYALLGKFDLVIIVDFPSVQHAMKASIGLSKLLGVSFTTSPAVSVEEFDQLVS